MDRYNSQLAELAERMLIGGQNFYVSSLAFHILRYIQDHPFRAEVIWHPLGFACFMLKQESNKTLRLHVWSPLPGEYIGVGWQIHKHNWSLASYVLCGSIENSIYLVRPNSHAPTHQIYEIEYQEQINLLRATGSYVRCETSLVEHISTGHSYTLKPGVYHSARVPAGSITATIVIATETDGVDTAVLGEINSEQFYRTERRSCSTDFIIRSVGMLLDSMQNSNVHKVSGS